MPGAAEVHNRVSEDVVSSAGMDPPAMSEVTHLFASMLDRGEHSGAQLAVYRNGLLVAELAGGRSHTGVPVTPESLIGMLSATKGLAAMVVHMLHDRGLFQYQDRVAEHWPEFGRNGKENVTIAHVLSHRAGLAGHPFLGYLSWPQWSQPGGIPRLVEELTLEWEPGTACGYHAHTYGHILDELVKRWTGQNIGEVLRAEICEPLGIKDVYIGLPSEAFERFVPFGPSTRTPPRPEVPLPAGGEEHFFNSYEILSQCLPWGSGVARARDLAALMNVFAYEGTYKGLTVFSPETFELAVTPTTAPDEVDRILQQKARWALGVLVGQTEGTPMTTGLLYGRTAGPRVCGHLGGNSAVTWADPDSRLAVAFLSLSAQPNPRYQELADAIRAACLVDE